MNPIKPRFGFVGLGWIGRNRLEVLQASGAAEAVALYEPEPSALQAAQAFAPDAYVCSSYAQLLEQAVDGVVIATPSALHASQSMAALERGLHVFCQKPLGRNASEVLRLVEAAHKYDCLLGVDLSYRRTRAVEQLARHVHSGALGTIFAVNLVFHNAYGPDKAWFYDARQSGGGALMDLGTHLVDLALWVLDFPQVQQLNSQLYHAGRPLVTPHHERVEDYAAAQFTLSTGAVVQLACSWRLHAGTDCVIAVDFFGSAGGVGLRNHAGSFYDFYVHTFQRTGSRLLAEPPDAWSGRALLDWARELQRAPCYDARCERLIDTAALIDRIYLTAGTQLNMVT